MRLSHSLTESVSGRRFGSMPVWTNFSLNSGRVLESFLRRCEKALLAKESTFRAVLVSMKFGSDG